MDAAAHDYAAPDAEQNGEEAIAPHNEEERLWGIVTANPVDFNSWTQLIQETEKQDDINKFRQLYDTFLAEFPLCYGYWKKYADHEHRLATPEKTVEVYERAVKAVTYSVDIWLHYCSFLVATKPEDPEGLRRLFERALSYVGSDYLAHPLWDKYIEFEYSQQNWIGITQLYTRILQTPLSALERYFTYFKELAANRPLSEIRGPDDSAEPVLPETAEADPTTEPPTSEAEDATMPKDPEVQRFIRVREALYKNTKAGDSKIREFESAIRRPYFHVKPLDDGQLQNWHRYLDFVEQEGSFEKILKTYERCLIACANYPEYWIRFVNSMEERNSIELANDALHRATHVFVKRRPEIHLFAAQFNEHRGDLAGARKEYTVLSSEIVPGLLEVIAKHANFEKRQGNLDGACAVYESALEVEKSKEDSRTLPFLYVQYIRFLNLAGLVEKARDFQAAALEKLPFSKIVILAAIHFETLYSEDKNVEKLENVVDKATVSGAEAGLTVQDREEISCMFIEFVETYGTPENIRKAASRHRQHFVYSRTAESKKRPAADALSSDRSKQAKAAAAVAAAAAVTTTTTPYTAPAYTNGQAQWSNYQQWQQGQWTQGYQANYNYGYPQQQGAYSAYPQAYGQDGSWTTASTW